MNITYLLGAGASYNALPILSELPDCLDNFITSLKNHNIRDNGDLNPKKDILLKDLEWLSTEIRNHQTVDTFARKLFLNTIYHNDLIKLKQLLTIYFLFEQTKVSSCYENRKQKPTDNPIFKQVPDKRYDSFIASIVSNKFDEYELNPSVKILTWNYDSQIEIAFKKFHGGNFDINAIQNHLQIFPNLTTREIDNSKFLVVRLNGSASIKLSEKVDFFDKFISNQDGNDLYSILINTYEKLRIEKNRTQINYSWENSIKNQFQSEKIEQMDKLISEISQSTDILVVIGYSFPIFNREMDKKIINQMNKLDRVYIQDQNPERLVSLMKNTFKGVKNSNYSIDPYNNLAQGDEFIPIITETNTDYFILPPELDS